VIVLPSKVIAGLPDHLSTAASRSSQIRLALSGAMDFTRLRVRESPFRNRSSRFNLAGKLIDALPFKQPLESGERPVKTWRRFDWRIETRF
jgi:hypothetical protein